MGAVAKPYPRPPARRHGLPAAAVLLAAAALLLHCAAAAAPTRITLGGGLMHTSGFFVDARVGGQRFHLQVDTSQGGLTVPGASCRSCRVGDRRYNVSKSTTGGRAVACDDDRCQPLHVCPLGPSGECPVCGRRGRCCVPNELLGERPLGLAELSHSGASCAYNLKFSWKMDGNGTMHSDTLQIGDVKVPDVLFGVMREETGTFEMAYVDGIIGLGFNEKNCHPTCTPAVMDYWANATGHASVFTMCAGRFGGALTLGAEDQTLASSSFKYVNLQDMQKSNHYLVEVKGYGKVGDKRIELPELASGVWSSATTSIVVGKSTFMTILEKVMEGHCDIPGLCSVNSWFRPRSCRALSDQDLAKMPAITFFLANDTPIVLEPSDYMLEYKVVDGKLYRCLAFVISDLLATKGVGIMLGSVIMRRYAVVYDRKNRQIGLAKAKQSECGPATGSTAGLAESSLGIFKNMSLSNILTADTPAASSGSSASALAEEMEISVNCRAIDGCSDCSSNRECAYGYQDGKCVAQSRAGSTPYPFCSGLSCVCIVVGNMGWYVGVLCGAILALVCGGCCSCAYVKRKRKQRYERVVPFEAAENELESF